MQVRRWLANPAHLHSQSSSKHTAASDARRDGGLTANPPPCSLADYGAVENRVTIIMPKLEDPSSNGRPADSRDFDGNEDTRRVIVKSSRRFLFLDTADIDWIEASGNYVRFHLGLESYTARAGIGRIAERLSGAEFVRIHRSTVVNIRKIKELEPCDNGEYIVVLKDGKKLSGSRGYSGRLQQMIKRGYAS
jgi:DNA-binding LytR/AlgR family response regulator